jgi:phage-related tail fiber protein
MSYQTLTTNLGLAKIAAAIGSGQTISLPTIKLGDGNGNPVTPSPTQIDLVRAVHSGATNSLTVSQSNPNRVTAELVVPASVGGFTVREAGIYDSTGALIFVSNFPDVYKPLPSEGAARDLVVRIVFEVVNSGVINLVIDTNVVVATRAWVTSNFTIAALLPGGTTYQILRKKSNANGDTEWVDPASGQNIVVNVIEENQILAASQTVVNLVTANTNSTAVYIEGVRLRNNQFSINTATQFTLAQSYPAGSRVTIVQNEPNGAIAQATTESAGIVELATNAETQAGTDAIRAVTPASLASRTATDARAGIVELATAEEVDAGTDTQRVVVPFHLTRIAPAGAVVGFARSTAPAGWLKANGAAISRNAYSALYAAIGTTFGAGDASTTFNLPDLRGVYICGFDDGRGLELSQVFGGLKNSKYNIDLNSTVVFSIAGSGTWIVPQGVTSVTALVVAGGGAGAGQKGSGGGGGGLSLATLTVTPNQSIIYNIGSGGIGNASYANGAAGGNSTFGNVIAYGGSGGNHGIGAGFSAGGYGTFAVGGNGGADFNNGGNGPSYNGVYYSGGGGGRGPTQGGIGGGGAGGSGGSGSNATYHGAGGGAGDGGGSGGNGFRGLIILFFNPVATTNNVSLLHCIKY